MDSPDGIRELRKLTSPSAVKQAVSNFISDNWNASLKQGAAVVQAAGLFGRAGSPSKGGSDVAKFKRSLGLDDVNSARHKTMEAALERSGVTMQQLRTFADSVEAAVSDLPPNINAFIARGVTIGGIRRLRTVLTPGAAVAGAGMAGGVGMVNGVVFVLASRWMGRLVTNPRTLELSRTVLNTELSMSRRRAAAHVLLGAVEAQTRIEMIHKFSMGYASEDDLNREEISLK